MTFSDMMRKAVAKIPKCRSCGVWPCGCKEIEARIAEQLKLKLPPETRWRDTRRERRTP